MFIALQKFATWLLAVALTGIWIAIAWLLVALPGVLAIAGVAYAAGSIAMLLHIQPSGANAKFEADAADIRREISGGGIRGFTFFLARPLFHFASLPGRSAPAAVGLAALLALPWLLVR